jgi:hypothetical protein
MFQKGHAPFRDSVRHAPLALYAGVISAAMLQAWWICLAAPVARLA